MMSDDPPCVSVDVGGPVATGSTVTTDTPSSVATVSEDDWGLPDQIEKMSRKELRRRHRGLIELLRRAGRGEANPKGGMQLVITAVQYLSQELARRNQDRQTSWIIVMTAVITFMTFVMMGVALWEHLPALHGPTAPVPPPAMSPS